MSAHAIHARRDLSDLFGLLLELLEPLFLFLLDGRAAAKPVAVPAGSGAGIPSELTPAIPAAGDSGDGSASAGVRREAETPAASGVPIPTAEPAPALAVGGADFRVEAPAGVEAVAVASESPAVGLGDGTAEERGGNPRPATGGGAVFVKVGGRFRPAPDGFDGPAFERVRSAGGRVTYRPVAA